MPGLVGIVSGASGDEAKRDLELMLASMMHEPYYTAGRYTSAECGLHLGWVSRNDGGGDCSPSWDENDEATIIRVGEEFSRGADRLADLYRSEGDRFVSRLNGWFGGIVIDHRRNRLILFNDRYGMHRIYCHEGDGEFLFSSEAKALLAVRRSLRQIEYPALGQFFSLGCVLENRSLFPKVGLLPGGSVWSIEEKGKKVRKGQYFDRAAWEESPQLEREEFLGRFVDTFRAVLPRYFAGAQEIGLSLTSGLDSRMIMAWLGREAARIPCYTFSGMGRELSDAKVAKVIATQRGSGHETLSLDEEFISSFPQLAEKTIYVTDGCHDICGAHDLYLNELARRIAPVRLTGKFGSEIVRDNSLLGKPGLLRAAIFDREFSAYVEGGETDLQETRRGHRLSFAAFKELPWHEYGRLAAEQSKLSLRTPYMDNDLVSLMYQAPAALRATDAIPMRVVADGDSGLAGIPTDRGQGGNGGFLVSKARRALGYLLFKSEYIRFFQPPAVLFRLESAANRAFGAAGKPSGSYQIVNYGKLFRTTLAEYVADLLLDRRTLSRPYLNATGFRKLVERHLRGQDSGLKEINLVLTAELIHRQLLENRN